MSKKNTIDKLSVVIPVYNEDAGIARLFSLLHKELEKLSLKSYEVILVNDGSSDDSATELNRLRDTYPQVVRVINLTRNFGKEAALSAGLHSVTGDCAVLLDADGQHPPDKIGEFLDAYADGYDMVVGMRTDNVDEKHIKKLGNKIYYAILKYVGISNLQPRVTDFRVLSQDVVEAFCELTERRRITRGLLDWMGFSTVYVEFEAPERLAGTATYNFKKLTYLAIDSILSNSRKPLAVSFILGVVMTTMAFIGTLFVTVEQYLLGDPLRMQFTGSSLLILTALFMIGLVLISQGIASLYLARIYEEAQQRPLYIINRQSSSYADIPRSGSRVNSVASRSRDQEVRSEA